MTAYTTDRTKKHGTPILMISQNIPAVAVAPAMVHQLEGIESVGGDRPISCAALAGGEGTFT